MAFFDHAKGFNRHGKLRVAGYSNTVATGLQEDQPKVVYKVAMLQTGDRVSIKSL
jgi:hypothetical protein